MRSLKCDAAFSSCRRMTTRRFRQSLTPRPRAPQTSALSRGHHVHLHVWHQVEPLVLAREEPELAERLELIAELDVRRPLGAAAEQLVEDLSARLRQREEVVRDEPRDPAAQRVAPDVDDSALDRDLELGTLEQKLQHDGRILDQAALDRLIEVLADEQLRDRRRRRGWCRGRGCIDITATCPDCGHLRPWLTDRSTSHVLCGGRTILAQLVLQRGELLPQRVILIAQRAE